MYAIVIYYEDFFHIGNQSECQLNSFWAYLDPNCALFNYYRLR